MQNPIARITVRNPALIAAFTPMFTLFPVLMLTTQRTATDEFKHWILIGYAILVVALAIIAIKISIQPHYLELYPDRIQFGKRSIPLSAIKYVGSKRGTRYVTIRTSSVWQGLNVQVAKKEEFQQAADTLKNWSNSTGIQYLDM